MSNLKIGDTVYYKGEKRKVTFLRNIFGGEFCHLSGYPFIVRASSPKPVIQMYAVIEG